MADNASLFVEIRELISCYNKRYVVFWMDSILCLERYSSRGVVNRSILVSILEQQYFSGEGFIRRFLTRWASTLPAYRFVFSDSS